MPRPRFYRLPGGRRERLIEAAGRELCEQGYDRASLNRILEQAGFSKGVAYYYFENKDDLLGTVLLEYLQRMLGPTDLDLETLTREDYWRRIEEVGRGALLADREAARGMGAVRALWSVPSERREQGALGEAWQRMMQWLGALVLRGQQLGAVRRDLPLSLLVAMAAAVDEASDRWLVAHREALTASGSHEAVEGIASTWRRLLSADPEAR